MAAPGIALTATDRTGHPDGGRGDRCGPVLPAARVGASTRAVHAVPDPAPRPCPGTAATPPDPPLLPASDGAEFAALPCRSHDPDMWFAERPVHLERAKELCRGCPIRSACLAGALARNEPWGVWGGQIVENGVVRAHKRGRGRPPKNAPSGSDTA